MGFNEKTLRVSVQLHDTAQFFCIFGCHPGTQRQQIGTDGQISLQDMVLYVNRKSVVRRLYLRRRFLGKANENNSLLPGFLVIILQQPVGAHIAVQNIDCGIRIEFFQS